MSIAQIIPSIACPAPVLGAGKQGIKRVTVMDADAQLLVTFWAPVTEAYLLSPSSYSLSGGQRLFPRVVSAQAPALASPPVVADPTVLLTLDRLGDFSIYTLTISGADLDPFFASAKLRFRLACDDSFDCRQPAAIAAPTPDIPVLIDYLSKDYSGFRQALLDFIPTRLPAWTERSEADIGMTLLELFAATADNLSYLQDRMANEAFLPTALERRSVAGHLALIGYQMDEGASALTWLQFQVNAEQALPASPGFKVSNQPASSSSAVVVFETLGQASLYPAHNAMALYDWGNSNCCLAATALTAALAGSYEQLQIGDSLLFDDGAGNRDIVRLTAGPQITQTGAAVSPPSFITVVTWSAATPLSQDYCVARTVVRGNLVPATHGETVSEVLLLPLATSAINLAGETLLTPARQRLALTNGPLSHLDPSVLSLASPLGPPQATASFTSRAATSSSTLALEVNGVAWSAQKTLLESGAASQVYRLELDNDGDATVVFGDGTFGKQPAPGASVSLTYRVGGGANGNIGADTLTLAHPVSPATWLTSVTNPVPARGGRDPESNDDARKAGPPGIHQTLVAVTPDDYQQAAVALTDANGQPLIQRANASFRWSGSWLTVTLSVDPMGTKGLTAELEEALLLYFGTKRLAGYDLEILAPSYISVDLQLQFTAAAGSFPDDVQQALILALSSTLHADGTRGFFYPDNFTFGQSLYVSAIYAAMMAVPGVQSATITRLALLHASQPDVQTKANLAQGYLAIDPDQIIRLDNDPNYPQNGTLAIVQTGASA